MKVKRFLSCFQSLIRWHRFSEHRF